MSLSQRPELPETGLAIAGRGFMPHRQQLVGHLGHGTYHHHWRLLAAAGHNLGNALDSLGALDRRAAKLHHNHLRTTLDDSAFTMVRPILVRKSNTAYKRKTHQPISCIWPWVLSRLYVSSSAPTPDANSCAREC